MFASAPGRCQFIVIRFEVDRHIQYQLTMDNDGGTVRNAVTNPSSKNYPLAERMEISESLQRGAGSKRRRRRPELLVWPSSYLSLPKGDDTQHAGFVVGWSTASSPEAPRRSEWPVETVVAAGIIPIGMDGRLPDIPHEYKLLQSKIQKMKEAYCFSCPCCEESNMANHSKTCAACTNSTCFDQLSILAFYSSTKSNDNLPNDLPVIRLSDEGYPRWSGDDENDDEDIAPQQQLLVYTDSVDKEAFQLYSHSFAPDGSYFSRVLLSRLTHAANVVDIITTQNSTHLPTVTPNVSTTASAPTPESPADTSTTGSVDAPWNVRFDEFLQRRSLFLRHCRSMHASRLPLWGLWIHSVRSQDANVRCHTTCQVCPKCQKRIFLSKTNYVSAEEAIADFDDMVAAGLDAVIGTTVGLLLAFWLVQESMRQVVATVVSNHYLLLRQSMEWLENFPIGFKLNEKLTENMGREMQSFISIHERFVGQAVSGSPGYVQHALALILLVTGVTLGGSGLVALLFDLFRIATVHISVVAACFRNIYRSELYMLAALWRLFRGKKRNVLRKRTDTMAYDSMQLLLGTILFAIALFLFTTVLVYHTFFAVLNLAAALLSASFFMVYLLIQFLPGGRLVLRKRCPRWFTCRVHISVEDSTTIKDTVTVGLDVTRLVPVAKSYGSIVSDALAPPTKAVLFCCSALLTELVTGVPSTKLLVETVSDRYRQHP
jgi:hypothetical protein